MRWFKLSDYYYTPLQRKGQRFFEEYIPFEEIGEVAFAPDLSHIFADPTPTPPEAIDPKRVLVYEGLKRLTSTPVGRGVLIGAYALSYLPLLEETKTSKTYGPSELMMITSGLGGGMRV